jgi:hypothetical protein
VRHGANAYLVPTTRPRHTIKAADQVKRLGLVATYDS